MISIANAKMATLATLVKAREACLETLLLPSFGPMSGMIMPRKNAANPKGKRNSSKVMPLF
jgi:hypothetical protein